MELLNDPGDVVGGGGRGAAEVWTSCLRNVWGRLSSKPAVNVTYRIHIGRTSLARSSLTLATRVNRFNVISDVA